MGRVLKQVCIVLLCCTVFLLGGCRETEADLNETDYTAEYKEFPFEYDSILKAEAFCEKLYLIGNITEQASGETKEVLCQYNLLTHDWKQLPVPLETEKRVQQIKCDSQGNILLIVETEASLELWVISSADGSVLQSNGIQDIFEFQEQAIVKSMAVDSEDNIYISDGSSSVYVIDKSGKAQCMISSDAWIGKLFTSKEGIVYAYTIIADQEEIRPVDLQKKELLQKVSKEVAGESGYTNLYIKGLQQSLLISEKNSVYTYDFQTNMKEILFDWMDVFIYSGNVLTIGELSDGIIWAVLLDENEHASLVYIKEKTKEQGTVTAEKEEIILGTFQAIGNMKQWILEFNRSNDQYEIKVKEYNKEDAETGFEKFQLDIISGNSPDLIHLSSLNFEQYTKKGIFEDIYPFMEKDGVKPADYLQNTFQAYEADGKLYGIVPRIYIMTTAVKESKLNAKGWTLSEMLEFVQRPEVENISQWGTKGNFLYLCLYNNINDFINWETGECYFDSDEFIRVLEVANRLPDEPDESLTQESLKDLLKSDQVVLEKIRFGSVQDIQRTNSYFGEKVNYIGIPDSQRKGNMLYPIESVAISAKSRHKEGAWEFVKFLLSEECQDGMVKTDGSEIGFPVKISSLEKQLKVYQDDQEAVLTVREILDSAEKLLVVEAEEPMIAIIEEETGAFFSGQKTAGEAAEIIQGRIQIFVKENS